MASKSPEEKVEFLLKVLATCTEFKPDYAQLKDAMGINTNANAQRQFKGIVEAGKMYTLESGGGQTRVIDNGGESVVPSPHTKARKHTKKGSDDGKEEEKPVKKPRTPKTKKVVEKSDDKETE